MTLENEPHGFHDETVQEVCVRSHTVCFFCLEREESGTNIVPYSALISTV